MNILFHFRDRLAILAISVMAWPVIALHEMWTQPQEVLQAQTLGRLLPTALCGLDPIRGFAKDLLVKGSTPPAGSGTSPPEQPASGPGIEPPPAGPGTGNPAVELAPTPSPPSTLWMILLPVVSGLVLLAAYWLILRSPSSRAP